MAIAQKLSRRIVARVRVQYNVLKLPLTPLNRLYQDTVSGDRSFLFTPQYVPRSWLELNLPLTKS
jgi:hypothetical protein